MTSVKPLHCNMCNGYLKDRVINHSLVTTDKKMPLTREEEVLQPEEGILLSRPSSLSSVNPSMHNVHCHLIIIVTNASEAEVSIDTEV